MYKIRISYVFAKAGKVGEVDIYTMEAIGKVEENVNEIAKRWLEEKEGLKNFEPNWADIIKVEKIKGFIFPYD